MKLLKNLKSPITGLDEQPVADLNGKSITVGYVIANSIAGGNSSEPARMMSLALGIYNAADEFKIGTDDYNVVKELLQKDLVLNNFAKSKAIKILEEAVDVIE